MIAKSISTFVLLICLMASCAYAVYTEKGSEKASSETIILLAEKDRYCASKTCIECLFFKCFVAKKEFDVKRYEKNERFFPTIDAV